MLTNQPQGGFITRAKSPDMDVAGDDGNEFSFGHWFGQIAERAAAARPNSRRSATTRPAWGMVELSRVVHR